MNELIVLGAGKPYGGGENHVALKSAVGTIKVIDWLMHSVSRLRPRVIFVAGFQQDLISNKYPGFEYVVNPEWKRTGATKSFLLAGKGLLGPVYACYGDVLFRDYVSDKLSCSSADICVVVDTDWRTRYNGRTKEDMLRCEKVCLSRNTVTRLGECISVEMADAEFVGFVRFGGEVLRYLDENIRSIPLEIQKRHLSALIEFLRIKGFNVEALDIKGDWAELNESADLVRFILGTKAQTLQRLQGLVQNSRIEDQVSFTVAEWLESSASLVGLIQEVLDVTHLVVRSSALSEDGFTSANAGAYTSVLMVDCSQKSAIREAIEEVISSYLDNNPANQVLVQPMVDNVIASGVAFTRTLAHGAPYYVVNYDDVTLSTESITSGTSREHKTLLVHRDSADKLDSVPEPLKNLIPAIIEIESLLDFDSLDIEFAISEGGTAHILQVRPIAVSHELSEDDDSNIKSLLDQAVGRFESLQENSPFVVGDAAYFGVMPDWNPAEIIGTKPGRMAMSLYRYLIMDSVWATQRADYGYRDVRPQPLLAAFAGHPYVDIRASFNSFVPATLDDELAQRLVNFYLSWLEEHPHLHDKVEFDVVPTCYGLDFERWQARLIEQGGFSVAEVNKLKDGLKVITRNAFQRTANDLASIAVLEERFERIQASDLPALEKALVLLEDCKRYGTLAFSHLARSAFVAVTLLKSAVNREIISQAAVDSFLGSIRTVTHQFTDSAAATAAGTMPWQAFVERYGHLRPGTYDITSPCYRDDPEHFLVPIVERAKEHSHQDMDDSAWKNVRSAFIQSLRDEGLVDSPQGVEQFMRDAIEGREFAKFVFSRNLSAALDCLVAYGEPLGISRTELSHITLDDLVHRRTGSGLAVADEAKVLKEMAEAGKSAHKLISTIELPPLITKASDFRVFLYPSNQANFVGSGRVTADCVDLQNNTDGESVNLTGKIALIPQADPGYDWLFGQDIAGLITMYGGANSHMSIRSAEFGLPAAIGVGETKYATLSRAKVLELDAGNRRLQVIR